MTRIQVIVNPQAGRGYAGRIVPQIRTHLEALNADYELTLTEGPGHAIELASQALDDGFDRIVGVGGDGTSHEVTNGLMARYHGEPVGTMGWIPAGSGNDCAVMNGAPADLEKACYTVVHGTERLMDVGTVKVDDTVTRYFDNAVGIGFDGLVTIEALKHTKVRGMALYLPVVLKSGQHHDCDQQRPTRGGEFLGGARGGDHRQTDGCGHGEQDDTVAVVGPGASFYGRYPRYRFARQDCAG